MHFFLPIFVSLFTNVIPFLTSKYAKSLKGERMNFAFASGSLGDWEFRRLIPPDLQDSQSPSSESNDRQK
jgi:hypothetical protein